MKGMLIVLKFDLASCVSVRMHVCVTLLGVGEGAEEHQGQMPYTAEDHAWVTVFGFVILMSWI